jgi:Protein of unknown function (DUF1161)
MPHHHHHHHLAFAALLLAFAADAAHAQAASCETLRAQIDTKVRASGASGYALAIVAADAKVAGKVVGQCELGSRKIVYVTGAEAPVGAASAPRDAKREMPILTECKDGTVTRGGDCRK